MATKLARPLDRAFAAPPPRTKETGNQSDVLAGGTNHAESMGHPPVLGDGPRRVGRRLGGAAKPMGGRAARVRLRLSAPRGPQMVGRVGGQPPLRRGPTHRSARVVADDATQRANPSRGVAVGFEAPIPGART